MRDLQLPGRSAVHGVEGAAATSHPLATLAAIDILRRGGNAVDAAIAACAVQGVVEPMSTGIGGDCFVLLWSARLGKAIGINGSGMAPQGLTPDLLLGQGLDAIPLNSAHSVSIPGAVDAWAMLQRDHGRLTLADVLQPAIDAAERGFALSPRIAVDWARGEGKLRSNPASARIYLSAGVPAPGDLLRFPALAETLRTIGRQGRDGFYRGPVAARMAATLREHGGVHSEDDFAAQHSYYVDPIGVPYRGVELLELPPNTHGIVALMMLNILSGYDLAALHPTGVERLHLQVEAQRLAFQARDAWVADPQFAPAPVARMLSPEWAAEARARIDPRRAMGPLDPMAGPLYRDTVYLTVVDRDRNVVSFINSLFFGFGSGITCPDTGVLFQNRAAGFRVEPGHPNCVAPGKRPLHTIIPGMAMRDGRPWLSYGVMGGNYQPVGHVHVLGNMVDHGMDVQEALDAPRVFHAEGKVDAERGVSDAVCRGLVEFGHVVARPDMPWGGGQAIEIDWNRGTLAAASDPRKDGLALAY